MRSVLILMVSTCLWAQHDMSQMGGMDMSTMPGMSMPAAEPMEASGTSMNPAASPMAMLQAKANQWTLMFHGVVFATDIQQSGPRGADKFVSMNWFMGEASHPLAAGRSRCGRCSVSIPRPLRIGAIPNCFRPAKPRSAKRLSTGSIRTICSWNWRLNIASAWRSGHMWLYVAPVGDPALGPVAYPHRVSAAELPQATLGHHLEDSTHISDDVVTLGASHGMFGLEASGFHGAEPGENRWIVSRARWIPIRRASL